MTEVKQDTPLVIAGKEYKSRPLVGSGKYKDNEEGSDISEADSKITTDPSVPLQQSAIPRLDLLERAFNAPKVRDSSHR